MRKNNSYMGTRDPDGKIGIKAGVVLLIWRFPDLMVGVSDNSIYRSSRLL